MRSLSLNLCLCTADLKFHTEQAVQRIENLWLECHPNEIRSRCEPISFEGRVHGIADSTIVWRPAIDRTALDRFETGISEAEFTKFEILRVCVRPLKFFYHRLIYLRYRVAKATYRPYDLSTRPSSDGVFDYRAEAEPTNFNVSGKNEHRSTIAVLYNAVTVLSVRSQVLLPTEERYFLAYEQLAGFSETSFRVWQRDWKSTGRSIVPPFLFRRNSLNLVTIHRRFIFREWPKEARKMPLFAYPREPCDFYLTTDERIRWVEEKGFVLPLPYARQFCSSFYSLSFRPFDFILDPNYPLKSFRSSYTFVYVEFQTT